MTNLEPPLPADVVDELLSAELDDELDAAAHDLGLAPDAVRAALAATPGVEDRRRALARARDALATPFPLTATSLDELVTRVLHADEDDVSARRHARDARRRAVFAAASVAAAVVVVVLAVAIMRSGGPSSKSTAGSPVLGTTGLGEPKHATAPERAVGVAFGDVSRDAALRSAVEQRLRAKDMFQASGTTAAAREQPAPPSVASSDRAASPPVAASACTARTHELQGLAPKRVLSGSGTWNGRPVDVLVFARGGAYVAYLVSPVDCSVLSSLGIP